MRGEGTDLVLEVVAVEGADDVGSGMEIGGAVGAGRVEGFGGLVLESGEFVSGLLAFEVEFGLFGFSEVYDW